MCSLFYLTDKATDKVSIYPEDEIETHVDPVTVLIKRLNEAMAMLDLVNFEPHSAFDLAYSQFLEDVTYFLDHGGDFQTDLTIEEFQELVTEVEEMKIFETKVVTTT